MENMIFLFRVAMTALIGWHDLRRGSSLRFCMLDGMMGDQ
jgi:hypothetical protein